MKDKRKENLYEAYTDENGFVWNESEDIVAIPEALKKKSNKRLITVIQMVREGKVDVRK